MILICGNREEGSQSHYLVIRESCDGFSCYKVDKEREDDDSNS